MILALLLLHSTNAIEFTNFWISRVVRVRDEQSEDYPSAAITVHLKVQVQHADESKNQFADFLKED